MEYLVICLTALAGSALTFFSGFGLGTLLLPIFGLFFPLELSIALTAIVHFLNNLFKLGLVGRNANWKLVLRFGIPSVIAALAGAFLLTRLEDIPAIYTWHYGTQAHSITWIRLIVGLLMILFALYELLPFFSKKQFDTRYLIPGGFISGFFGGLSGHQGALRSAFLVRSGLSKEAFIATGVVIACMVDISRLSIYARRIITHKSEIDFALVAAATLSAFMGAWLGNRLLKKVTLSLLQYAVATLLILFALLAISGII